MIKSLFFKWCYKLGFYPTKIKTPQETYALLKQQSKPVQEYELSRLSYAVAYAHDHQYYETLLKQFVPAWGSVKTERPKFIGEGYGSGSLDAYRSVWIKDTLYFEKVYFNTHSDYQKTRWFHEHAIGLLDGEINLPKIEKIYSGALLSIVYFQFFELPKPENTRTKDLVKMTKTLYRLSQKKADYFSQSPLPDLIYNFKHHHQYKKCIASAIQEMTEKGIDPKKFVERAKNSKRVLTHGDMQKNNVYANSILLDWDSFGIYPIGFEQAFLFFRLIFKGGAQNDVEGWLNNHYRSFIAKADWKDFQRNFTYFLYVFSMEIFIHNKKESLKNELLAKLKSYA